MASDLKPKEGIESMRVPSLEETLFKNVYVWASRSKSLTTKIGAILIRWEDKTVISHGYNGLARGVNDDIPERKERITRVPWDVHAENNAILNCARLGIATKGSYMFTNAFPCNNCASAIVQAGIKKVVIHKQWRVQGEQTESWKKWIELSKYSEVIFKEGGVKLEEFDKILGVLGFLDGKIIYL